jgi:predicted CoA-binding protein
MLCLWIAELVPLFATLFSFIYGLNKFFKKGKPLFLQSITMAMGCHALGSIYHLCQTLTTNTVLEGFTPAYLGRIGFFLFLLVASYGQMDRIIDDGTPPMSRARKIALTAPLAAVLLYVPNALIEAIVSANDARKRDVVETVLAREPKRIGIYRLAAKTGSDNMRSSAAADIVNRLVARGADVVIYEPLIADEAFRGARVTRSLEELFDTCDIVLANRMDDELLPYRGKVFTRDLFHRD